MISGLYTAFTLLVFLGVVAWAWSARNKSSFDQLSQLALEDDETIQKQQQEQSHE